MLPLFAIAPAIKPAMATALSLRSLYPSHTKAMKTYEPFALTIKEVARYLGISQDSVRALIYGGELKAFDAAPNSAETGRRHWRVTPDALEDFKANRGNR